MQPPTTKPPRTWPREPVALKRTDPNHCSPCRAASATAASGPLASPASKARQLPAPKAPSPWLSGVLSMLRWPRRPPDTYGAWGRTLSPPRCGRRLLGRREKAPRRDGRPGEGHRGGAWLRGAGASRARQAGAGQLRWRKWPDAERSHLGSGGRGPAHPQQPRSHSPSSAPRARYRRDASVRRQPLRAGRG